MADWVETVSVYNGQKIAGEMQVGELHAQEDDTGKDAYRTRSLKCPRPENRSIGGLENVLFSMACTSPGAAQGRE
jgi:hypothetical protein